MADLNFPVSPADQQLYNFAGKTWKYLTSESRWSFVYGPGYGITSLNSLTNSLQTFSIGTSGTGFSIISSGNNHEFRLPIAGAGSTGLITTLAQTIAGEKTFTSNLLINSTTDTLFRGSGALVVWGGVGISGNAAIGGSIIFTNSSNTNIFAIRAGATGANVTYTLPATAPTLNQVLAATTVSGTNITLGWAADQTGSGGLASLNGETVSTQVFATSTSGTEFTITSSAGTHTFNIPIAGSGSTGLISTLAQTIAGAKTFTSNIIGNLSGTATTATNINLVAGATDASHSVLFSQVSSGSGVAVSSDSQLTYNPSTNVLAASTFLGNLTGTATTSTNSQIREGNESSTHYVVFSPFGNSTSGVALSTSNSATKLGYNPNTNVLTTTLSGTATTSINSYLAEATHSADHYVVFSVRSTGSGVALSTSNSTSKLAYNPNSNVLTVGSVTGNVSGTATTSTNSYIRTGNENTDHFVVFSPFGNSTSGIALSSTSSATKLGYNPNTNVLTTTLSGTATTSRNTILAEATQSAAHYVVFSLSPTSTSGTALSTSNSTSKLAYNPNTNVLTVGSVTGNLTGTATTSTNVYIKSGNENTDHFVVFSPFGNSTSGIGLSTSDSSTKLGYNPNTNVLTTTLSGTATTSRNTILSAATHSADHYVVFSLNPTSTSGTALSTSNSATKLAYNPNTNVLIMGTGSLTANSVRVGHSARTVDTSTGNLILDSSGGQVDINDNVVISGNLTVQGSTITVDSTISTIVDPVIVLGSGIAGTHSSLDNNMDRGIEFKWVNGSGVATTGFFGFSDSDGRFRFIPDAAITSSNVYSGTAGTAVFTQVLATLAGNAAGVAATYTNFYGTLSGTASTSTNSQIREGNESSTHYVVFSPFGNSTSGVALSTSNNTSKLAYNPNINVLTVGSITGNVTGTATTTQNTYLAAGGTDADHYLTFSRFGTSTSGIALSITNASSELTYNPVTKQLKLPYITGTAITATHFGTWAGSTITSFYGGTGNRTYTKGDLLVGGLGSTLMVLPKGPSDRYLLRVDSSNSSVGLGWTTFAGTFVTSIAPASSLIEGDLWYKVDDGSFNVYYIDEDNTAQWVEIVGGSGAASVAAAGSASEVQFNNAGVLDGDPGLVYATAGPTLSIKGFPVDAQTGLALELLGPGKTLTATTGTFFGINSASGYSGKMIDVQNNDSVKFSVASDGATYIATLVSNGAVYSNSGTLTNSNPSDQNLKQNIQSMIGGTVFVNELNPVSFEWKSEANGTGTKYGFIAQEVQQVIPEIVSTDSTGTIGLDTVSMIPFLVKAIKEQQEVINTLKVEIQNIKSELGI